MIMWLLIAAMIFLSMALLFLDKYDDNDKGWS